MLDVRFCIRNLNRLLTFMQKNRIRTYKHEPCDEGFEITYAEGVYVTKQQKYSECSGIEVVCFRYRRGSNTFWRVYFREGKAIEGSKLPRNDEVKGFCYRIRTKKQIVEIMNTPRGKAKRKYGQLK